MDQEIYLSIPQDQEEKDSQSCRWENFFAISALFRMFFMVMNTKLRLNYERILMFRNYMIQVFAAVGIIASALSQTQGDYGAFPTYSSTRIAYLAFSAAIFFIQTIILVLDVTNKFNSGPLNRLPIPIIVGALFYVICLFKAEFDYIII